MISEQAIAIAVQNRFCTIISKGTNLPVSVTDHNYAIAGPDRDVEVWIYRGEGEYPHKDNLIGVLHLDPMQPEQGGFCRFAITYSLDTNGVLIATVYNAGDRGTYQAQFGQGLFADNAKVPVAVEKKVARSFHVDVGPNRSRSVSADVFISHAEEDLDVVEKIAQALDSRGFSTWYYKRDGGIPGVSYLEQIAKAIERCFVVLVVVSQYSLGSHQVTSELVSAFEACKPFMPVLHGIEHIELKKRKPIWCHMFGPATSISIPSKGVRAIISRVAVGLNALGVVLGDPMAQRKDQDH